MRSIRNKSDIELFLKSFRNFADYDTNGQKYYFIFDDMQRDGQWTLMLYGDEKWSLHGKGMDYCDELETFLEQDELSLFLWKNRKMVNNSLKQSV